MKFVIFLLIVAIATISALPLESSSHSNVENLENSFNEDIVSSKRVRRQTDYIKAGAVHSSKYGGGGEIVVNKNLASSKHHSVDAQTKYKQYGNHREGWAGINYSVNW